MERQIPTIAELRLLARRDVLLSHAFHLFDHGNLPLRDVLLVLVKIQHDQIRELREQVIAMMGHDYRQTFVITGPPCPECPINLGARPGPDPSGP